MISILKRPMITEKSTIQAAAGTYLFEVERNADKADIKAAVEKAFNVKVNSVRTQVCRDRARRTGKSVSKIKYWKKAFVRLAPGDKIDIFEGA